MNKETLKRKAAEWTIDKAQSFMNYCPMSISFPNDNAFWEYADDGMYIVSGICAYYFNNNGTILSLAKDIDDPTFAMSASDYETVNKLHQASLSQNFRVAKLTEVSYVEVNGELRQFKSYESPNGQLGIPHVADFWDQPNGFTEEYLKTFIDQHAWMIHTLHDTGSKYPQRSWYDCRLRNDSFFYFYNMHKFDHTYEYFYALSIDNLNRILSENPTRKNILPKFNLMDRASEIINYAEQQWAL